MTIRPACAAMRPSRSPGWLCAPLRLVVRLAPIHGVDQVVPFVLVGVPFVAGDLGYDSRSAFEEPRPLNVADGLLQSPPREMIAVPLVPWPKLL